jgi:riboflavin kinase/FMN adenylyltransferase
VHVWTDVEQVPPGFGPSVVTIGNFDGVHRGHRDVLTRMVQDARAAGTAAAVVTFEPHPAQVHRPESAPPLLSGLADRLALLAETGLDAVLVCHYTLEFAAQTPEEFVEHYLVRALGATTVVVGRDVRFGRGNSGDLATMQLLGERFGFAVEVIDDIAGHPDPHATSEVTHRRWSSTWARELLAEGDVAAAAVVLGRPHVVRGVVVRGDARGRALGFPTANLSPDATGMVPADGVYAGWLRRRRAPSPQGADEPGGQEERLPAAISVGTNPTFGGTSRRVEAYVLARDDLDLYGEEVALDFVARVRPTVTFEGADALVAQMRRDCDDVADLLGVRRAERAGAAALPPPD